MASELNLPSTSGTQITAEGRIDFHHHFFPSGLNKAGCNAKVGWKTPPENLPWSPDVSLKAMNELGIRKAILSLPAGTYSRVQAREHNRYAASVCLACPDRFRFLATLPDLRDVEGVLDEIVYAIDNLGADGVALSSSYGEGDDRVYCGDDRIESIWTELDRRRAVVFLHGTQVQTSYPHPFLGIPIVEVPHETFKAAAQLVVSGKKRKYSQVKVVLAHLGGTVPFLASRVAVLSRHMGCPLSIDEILQDFKSFYYEVALSGYESSLEAMQKFVPLDRILFGSDIPAVSVDMAQWFTRNVDTFYENNSLEGVMQQNALRLLPGLNRPFAMPCKNSPYDPSYTFVPLYIH
ncbi:amidohydrolase 2 [Neolentinus lepideus HHB14362 ss-1]|uniref:6-methylsalicylate decarboxylase n=1 Tax=Neolentinus lepideus HHB14362 ss-1 TaxID=1314782 RepID=A0A165P117_9AGAM|nr:amidohydrolase 2 [Neolentinus lepideus HHB14362 ss-1]